jgi:Tfp pilus assembly protein PilF
MKHTRLTILFLFIFSILVIPNCAGKQPVRNRPGQLKKGSPEFYLNEGNYYLNAGNYSMAEKKFRLALQKNPDLVGAINGMGIVYLQKREYDKAAQNFRQVIRLSPNNYDAYNYLGVIFTETGRYELAKENFLIAANSDKYRTPENSYANLARLELSKNKLQSALRYVDKGLEKNKGFAPLYNIKGAIFERGKEYKKALYYYEKALSLLTEDDVAYLINIGRVHALMGQKNKALDILEKALPKAYTPELKQQIHKMIKALE